MVGDDRRHVLIAEDPAAQARDARLGVEQRLRRCPPHRQDQPRPDERDLAHEVRRALRDLVGLRVAVSGRAALQHVRDVDVLSPAQPDRREHAVEKAPRLADERFAARVLLRARGFADDQPRRALVADPEHGVSPGPAQVAPLAARDRGLELVPVHARDPRGAIVEIERERRGVRCRIRDNVRGFAGPRARGRHRPRAPAQPPSRPELELGENALAPLETHSARLRRSASSRPLRAG
jgi:hypothetical protein